MAGTKDGAAKRQYNTEHLREIGRRGGKASTPATKRRGFASTPKDRLIEISSKGGSTPRKK